MHLHLIKPRLGEGEAHQPVNPYVPAAAGRQGEGVEQAAGTAVVGLGALADLARANVGIHVPILPGPGANTPPVEPGPPSCDGQSGRPT